MARVLTGEFASAYPAQMTSHPESECWVATPVIAAAPAQHFAKCVVLAVIACVLAAQALPPSAARAGGYIVVQSLSGWSDPTACSLRDGILAANLDTPAGACPAGNGDDTILINVAGTINLTTTLPTIIQPLAIRGPGPNALTIQHDPGAPPGRLIEISGTNGSPFSVTITGLRLSDGYVPGLNGGAVLVNDYSALTVKNVAFENNLAANGGAIFAQGPLEVTHSIFRNNVAQAGGGAAYTTGGAVISASLFISNTATGGTIISPSLGGGGAIRLNTAPDSPRLNWVVNSVFAGNTIAESAVGGAAIRISSAYASHLVHNTIVGGDTLNPQSAIYASGAGDTVAYITNTIVTSHTIGIHRGTQVSVTQDFNLFYGVITHVVGQVAGGANTRAGAPSFVDPTTDNYRLQTGSSAVDAAASTDIGDDYDGQLRPLGFGPDIGAFEFNPGWALRRVYLPVSQR